LRCIEFPPLLARRLRCRQLVAPSLPEKRGRFHAARFLAIPGRGIRAECAPSARKGMWSYRRSVPIDQTFPNGWFCLCCDGCTTVRQDEKGVKVAAVRSLPVPLLSRNPDAGKSPARTSRSANPRLITFAATCLTCEREMVVPASCHVRYFPRNLPLTCLRCQLRYPSRHTCQLPRRVHVHRGQFSVRTNARMLHRTTGLLTLAT
jgi:hypothetical protein